MKKHLIAAAVAAAVAVPAMAQNVSVYGTLEVGLEKNRTTAAVSSTSVESHEFVSNRLGFRGEEDLGGGLKAFFRLESGLNTSDGTAGSAAGGTNTLFDRGAEIGLAGAFGRIAVGKLDHNGIENNEISLHGNRGLGAATVEVANRASDLNDTISYTTPAFMGLTLNLMATPKDNGAAGIAGANAAGDSVVAAHDGVTSAQVAGTVGGIGVKLGTGTYKEPAGTKTRVTGFSAQYDFKSFNASVLYQTQDNPLAVADRRYTAVTAAIPLGAGLTGILTYATLDVNATATGDEKNIIATIKKDLSKRTALYGMYRSSNPGAAGLTTATTLGAYLSTSF
jgi:predicted porin